LPVPLQSFVRGLIALLLCAGAATAHETISTKLTWSGEISRIIYKRCVHCHRDGGSAFSLIHYAEARPWAKAIKEEVLERRMPPWGAVAGFGRFADDQALSMEELHLLSDWVEGGAPEGDPKYLPEPPPFRELPTFKPEPGIAINSETKLKRTITVKALRPENVPEKGSLRAVALLPGGRVQPLIWIYNYQPKWPRNFALAAPVRLPAGTVVQVSGSGRLILLPR
jgi:hypothetical protein